MANKGFLLVFMHPPPAFEEEFNAWYDSEHVPERLAVPGVLTALRYMHANGGVPRYLAMYDLEHASVMDSPAYLRVAHEKSSPWTKRVTARARVQRFAGEQVYPGHVITGPAARIQVLRFRGLGKEGIDAVIAGMRASYEGRPEVKQVRVLLHDNGTDVLGFIEARAPLPDHVDLAAFGVAADALDLVGSYAAF
ncbi:MAG: hypothetical protein JWR10_2956 [Rubritepida sp.]|nr:hypothetical protein [Rubritepida sp.]